MRIISSSTTRLSLQWRAIRLAITTIVILMASLFVIGSAFPLLRPSCCVADIGISCSSCGITRSITSILHGDFESSKAFHQGGIFLVALVAVSLASRPLPYLFPSSRFIVWDALAFVIAWIISAIIFFGAPGSGYRGIPRAEQDVDGQPPLASLFSMFSRNSDLHPAFSVGSR